MSNVDLITETKYQVTRRQLLVRELHVFSPHSPKVHAVFERYILNLRTLFYDFPVDPLTKGDSFVFVFRRRFVPLRPKYPRPPKNNDQISGEKRNAHTVR